MADVFISYARDDRSLAQALAERLIGEGRSVWWDADATPGAVFRDEIARELAAAKTVVVIWTQSSVRSQWVISEAQRALTDGKLIPLRTAGLDPRAIPQPFDTLHTPLLDGLTKIAAGRSKLPRSDWLAKVMFRLWIVGVFVALASGPMVVKVQSIEAEDFARTQIFDQWAFPIGSELPAHYDGVVRMSPRLFQVFIPTGTAHAGGAAIESSLFSADVAIGEKLEKRYWAYLQQYYVTWAGIAALTLSLGFAGLRVARWVFKH